MEYCLLEWIWDQKKIACYFRDGRTIEKSGDYAELAQLLTELGQDGWQVSTNSASANWLMWTLHRSMPE